MDDIFRGYGVEIKLQEDDDFLKVRETLTRIGISSRKDNTLFQSCHILHKQGRYAIVHFKELFALDGKPADMTEEDVGRRNTIAKLLDDWELIEILEPEAIEDNVVNLAQVKILPFREKNDWNLVAKYSIGSKK